MKKAILSLACLVASIYGFSQVKKVTTVGVSAPIESHVRVTKLNAETGLKYGWSTLSAVAEVDPYIKNWSVGAGYRLEVGKQAFKPFIGVNGLVDLFDDKKLGVQPQVGIVVSNPKNTPVGLMLFGQGNVKQRSKPLYEAGVKLMLNL